jgi:hypothetical protein
MRTALALVTLPLWACDGGANNPMVDGAVGDMMEEVTPDAPSAIDGVWKDTFYTTGGPMTVSACTIAPMAVTIDQTTAATMTYSGACKPDGTFRITAPGNIGTYYLRVQSALYATDKRNNIDLSLERLGRNDIASVSQATLGFTMTGLQSWTAGDVLVAYSSNLGYRQTLTFSSGAPTVGATSLTGVAPWSGYKVDSSKSDALQILQLGKHTTGGGLGYVSLDRVFDAPAFTMSDNTQHPITGAFSTASSSSLTLTVNAGTFNNFSSEVGPSVTTRSIQGSMFAALSSDVIESPTLFSFAQSSEGVNNMAFGTIAFGDPFPSAWKRYVKVQVAYSVPYTYNSASGTLNATVTRIATKATAEAGTLVAELGPPTQIKFDNDNAMTDTAISPVPLVSWSPPSSGSATDYEVQVYEAKANGTVLSFNPVIRLVTKSTSVRIPNGYLLGQRQYVFSIRARVRVGVDISTTPLRAGTESSSAEAVTALVTTDS